MAFFMVCFRFVVWMLAGDRQRDKGFTTERRTRGVLRTRCRQYGEKRLVLFVLDDERRT
jgi:hypothetical protein